MTIEMNGCKNLNCIGNPNEGCRLSPRDCRGYYNGNGPHPDGCDGKPENAGPECPARPTGSDAAEVIRRFGQAIREADKQPARRASILEEAVRIRSGERNTDYGDAVENFRRITEIANAITGLELTSAQCCKVMIAVKLARELHNHKRDNLVDMCGYADILELIETSKPVGDEK